MKTISSGYKLEKVRLLLDLKDSSDLVIQIANAKNVKHHNWCIRP